MTFDNVGYAIRELKTRLTIIPFCIRDILQLISFLHELFDSCCHDLESCTEWSDERCLDLVFYLEGDRVIP
jgi:hypothetical protein